MNGGRRFLFPTILVLGCILLVWAAHQHGLFGPLGSGVVAEGEAAGQEITLPEARTHDTDLGELIYRRRSVRSYLDEEIPLEKVSDILWSTVGTTVDAVTGPTRAAPSAGATDPLVVYLSARRVEGLDAGIYRYHPGEHGLSRVVAEDRSSELARAGLGQTPIRDAPFTVIVTARYERTTGRYGERGERYVKMEAGHATQNANLMAENLGLSGVVIGAFSDDEVREVMGGIGESPLVILPLGRKR